MTDMERHMSTTYTVENVHRLLRALLGESWRQRKEADGVLMAWRGSGPEQGNAALMALIDGATDGFGPVAEVFLRELAIFWMNTLAEAHASNIGGDARGAARRRAPWAPLPSSGAFPIRGRVRVSPFDVYGVGTGWYLTTQARRQESLIDIYLHGLSHPAPFVADVCWEILGRIPGRAGAALERMLEVAFRAGPHLAPGQPMRWLAAIFDAQPGAEHLLIRALSEPEKDSRVEVVAAIARHLAVVPPALFASMLHALDALEDPEQRFAIVRVLSALAARRDHDDREAVLRRAEQLTTSEEAPDRGGAAWSMGHLGTPAVHEPQLLALLRDRHWIPRADAAGAAALWRAPSRELVMAVAALLGDHEGPDGEPHDTALATLLAWGPQSAPAAASLAAWMLADLDDDPPRPDEVWRIIEALGPAAGELRSAVSQLVAAWGQDSDGDDSVDHESGDTPSATSGDEDSGSSWLRRIGVDPHEDIPGTPSSHERAAMPEAIDHIRQWLRGGGTP